MESILDCLDIAGPGRTRNIARKGRDDEHNLHVGFRYLKHEQQNTKSPLPCDSRGDNPHIHTLRSRQLIIACEGRNYSLIEMSFHR
jgi:hypothetical protein